MIRFASIMPGDLMNIAESLLPTPKELRAFPGVCSVAPPVTMTLRVDDSRVERAVLRWEADLRNAHCERRIVESASSSGNRSCSAPDRRSTCHIGREAPRLTVVVDRAIVPRRDGYRLRIEPGGIELAGGSPAGCFYGLQTLAQLSRAEAGNVPCGTIVDWPDFMTRGVLLDVTRGKVPTVDTLRMLVDRLAELKVNQLQLYIEHAFVFSFDEEICAPEAGLTRGEVGALDAYCRDRFIDLVPALATFGHMGRILSMPRYRHLAEVEATGTWDEMSWLERARGLTLDCTSPEAHLLVERMWTDVLDAFSSPVVNICGDEPWDLGRGKNRRQFATSGICEAYLAQILRTHRICAARDRRAQFWSDVVRNHPELLNRLPRDVTVLHWAYDDSADHALTAMFTAAGLTTFVCPGTSGWKRIINAIGVAERNIASMAAAGRKHGAAGLLNTDWGDHGHFNLPACSWHGIALGAALGWSADHPTGREFDERLARVVLRTDDTDGIRLLRQASRVADDCETWRLLRMPLRAVSEDPSLPGLNETTRIRCFAGELRRWCERAGSIPGVHRSDLTELAVAARFTELFAEKAAFAHHARNVSTDETQSGEDRRTWAGRLRQAADAYADCWRARNKPSGLQDLLRALSAAADDIHR